MNMSVPTLRAVTLAQRPEVQMARAKIDGEKSKLQLAHRAWIPDPAISVRGQRYNEAAQGVSELDAGVSFTVPWVNPRKYSAGVREAQQNVAAAEQALDREQTEALRLLRDQLAKIETAHHHVELFQRQTRAAGAAGIRGEPLQLRIGQGLVPRLDQRTTKPARHRGDGARAPCRLPGRSRRIGSSRSAPTYTDRCGNRPRKGVRNEQSHRKNCDLGRVVALLLGAAACSKKGASGKPANVDYYTCTMHPSVREKEPGKCPICSMDLVPVMKESATPAKLQQTAASTRSRGNARGKADRRRRDARHARDAWNERRRGDQSAADKRVHCSS